MSKKIQRLKIFFKPMFQLKLIFVFATLVSAILSGADVVGVYLLKLITNYIESGDLENLLFITYVFLGLISSVHIIGRLIKYIEVDLKLKTKDVIYDIVVNKFIKLDNNKSESIGTGKFIAILQNGIGDRGELLKYLFWNGMKNLFRIIFAIIFVYLTTPEYFWIFFILFLFFMLTTYYTNIGALRWRKERIEATNAQTKQLVKIIMSKFEILQNAKTSKEIDILKQFNLEARKYTYKTYFWLRLMFLTPIIIIDLVNVGVVFVIGVGVINGIFTIGDFVALSAVIVVLNGSVRDLIEIYKNSTQMYTNVEKMFDVFEEIPQIKGYDNGNIFKFLKGDINIEDMNFAYGDKMIFDNFNLQINGGAKTAIVGISGSGKTTLVKLIAGYLYPNSGKIIIDKQNLKDISLKSFYRNIGYLTQDPGVLDTSIYENLVYGLDNKISMDQIKIAIKMAQCEFVYEFKDGLETQIGERGIRLSGGQKQRLAIAKLFLKNPKILILDEPTSALDSFSEEKISIALNKLFQGRTVIIIAHRLQTVIEADDIIVLKDGNIIERGSHNKLSKLGGEYSKMLDLQSGVFVNGKE